MSNEAITWCAGVHPGKGPKGVLFCLADRASNHAGGDWTCFPSIADIIEWTDYSRAAVERNLQLLWREGYVSRKRRRRADGSFGIYDYTLHRDAEHRAALKASRAAVEDVAAAMEDGVPGEAVLEPPYGPADPAEAAEPHGILQHGPCVISGAAMPQNTPSPCGKMRGQEEPSREPSREPSPGARDLAALFGQIEAAVPARVLKFTDRERAFQALVDAARLGVEVEQLVGCARRMAADPEFRSRKFASPLEVWIGKGQWRGWLPEANSAAAAVPPGRTVPDWLRAKFLAVTPGDGPIRSYLDPCVFDPGPEGSPGRLLARTGVGRDWLERTIRSDAGLRALGMAIEVQGRA